jgi:hypothetical protein
MHFEFHERLSNRIHNVLQLLWLSFLVMIARLWHSLSQTLQMKQILVYYFHRMG